MAAARCDAPEPATVAPAPAPPTLETERAGLEADRAMANTDAQRLSECFSLWSGGDDYIEAGHVGEVLRAANGAKWWGLTEDTLASAVEHSGTAGARQLTLPQVMRVQARLETVVPLRDGKGAVDDACQALDPAASGAIDAGELRRLLTCLNGRNALTKDDADEFIAELSKDAQGRVLLPITDLYPPGA
jgi:Ca2+-binding EF-hand superfamily protein